jgi:hypothetical protein
MQAIQNTSNKFHDNNKYTNWLNTYKYVIRCICLQLCIILGNQCSFLSEFEANNESNPL